MTTDETSREPPRWTIWAPAVAALAGHFLALRNGFVLDDENLVTQNPYLRSIAGLWTLVRSGLFVASQDPSHAADYYRPLASALNWLSWQLFRDGRAGQHGFNVAMHVGVTLLLARALRRWNVSAKVAAIAAGLFAVHPATAEIVAYVGGRQEMLGWLFVLAALAALPSARTAGRCALLGAAATVLGAFSREAFLSTAAVLPIAAGLPPWADRHDSESAARTSFDRRRAGATAIGVAAGVIVAAVGRTLAGMRWAQPTSPHPPAEWIETAVAFAARMAKDLIAPTDLVVDLALALPSLPVALLASALAAASVPLVLRALRGPLADRRGIALTGLFAILAGVAIHTPVALRMGATSDRYAYTFAVAAVMLAAPLAERAAAALAPQLAESPLRRLLPALPWLCAAALLPATWARVAAYADEAVLQRRMYEDRPDDPQSKMAEANRLLKEHDCVHALPLCVAYQDYYPKSSRAAPCIAMCYLALGKKELALPSLRRYVSGGLEYQELRVLLIQTLFDVGDLDGVEQTLDAWGPPFANEPDVLAARRELERRRAKKP